MDRWMDGWMGGWIDGKIEGWMDGWIYGKKGGWMDGWQDRRMDGEWVSNKNDKKPNRRKEQVKDLQTEHFHVNFRGINFLIKK